MHVIVFFVTAGISNDFADFIAPRAMTRARNIFVSLIYRAIVTKPCCANIADMKCLHIHSRRSSFYFDMVPNGTREVKKMHSPVHAQRWLWLALRLDGVSPQRLTARLLASEMHHTALD